MAAPKSENPIIVALTLDFETGGLNCQESAITQIAMHATRLDTFERIGSFVRYIYPYKKKEIAGVGKKKKVLKNKLEVEEAPLMEYNNNALVYSAITMEMLYDKGEDLITVANELIQWITDVVPKAPRNMKPFIIGQNIDFDKGFLMQMMEYAGLTDQISKLVRGQKDFYGHWQPLVLDTITLGQLALCHLDNINSYKLELLCENLGIELDDAHDADADVSATTNVVSVLTQRMRNTNGEGSAELGMSKSEKTRKHFKI